MLKVFFKRWKIVNFGLIGYMDRLEKYYLQYIQFKYLVYNYEYRLIIGSMDENWFQEEKKKVIEVLRFGFFLFGISFGSFGFSQNYECIRESCFRFLWLFEYLKWGLGGI